MTEFKTVMKIYKRRMQRRPNKKHLIPKRYEAWMDKDQMLDGSFYCHRLNFQTDPVTCLFRRSNVQHPSHEVCINCPLGLKIELLTCVGHHGRHKYCPTCPSRAGCNTVTRLIHNPKRAFKPIRLRPVEIPAQESTVAKNAVKSTPKNKKAAEAEDEEDEDEDTEEEEVEEEEDDDAEDEDEDDSDDEDEDEEDEDEEEEEEKPKKGKKKGPHPKGKVPKGLVPREPVKVPASVLKGASKEVKKLLAKREEAQAKGDKEALRKIRAALRKEGFRLSSIGGQSENAGAPKKKAKKDEDDDE